jgi:hypothetical protein
MISTRVHGMLDYSVGLFLILVPWVFGFARGGPESAIFVALGASALLYSFFTNYELGAVKILPMKVHLSLDFLSGALLAASPWLFGFSQAVYLPHLVLGIFEMSVAVITQKQPAWRGGTTRS